MLKFASAWKGASLRLTTLAALALAGAAIAEDEGKERLLTPFEVKEQVAGYKKMIASSLERLTVYAEKAGDDDIDGCEASKLALGKTLSTSADEAVGELYEALESGDLALAQLQLKKLEQAAENASSLEDAAEICAVGSGSTSGDLNRSVSGQTDSEDGDVSPLQDNPLDFGYDPDDRVVSPF